MFPPSFLQARDLVKVYGDRRVLDGVSLTASPGQRIGLIGENGVGKSTLLRLLAGVEPADSGEVTRPAGIGFGHQELPYPGAATVRTVLDDALADVRSALHRLDELGVVLAAHPSDPVTLAGYGEVLEWAQQHDAWDADRRAALVLAGLGLDGLAAGRRLDTLSGGQRSRLALAALLIRRPGALLLDEPTNHLDDQAVEFVEDHLRELPGVVVVASHDRVFLDAVCTQLVDLDPARHGPTRYRGAYSDYLDAKRAERARWEQQYHLIAPSDLDRPVCALSAGQRRRLALALLVADTPHVLLLDEPTNHLSLALVEELEEALRVAPGAVVAASHDRWLRRRWDGPELRLQSAS